jgi:hypothetical protein
MTPFQVLSLAKDELETLSGPFLVDANKGCNFPKQ